MSIFKKNSSESEVKSTLKKELVKLAVECGADSGAKLDFSENSLKELSNILDQLHSKFKENPEIEGLTGVCYNYGFYIMSVFEKNICPGRFELNDPEFGEGAFPFFIKQFKIFPVSWCMKQVENGKEDNIYVKYMAFKDLIVNNTNK